MYDQNFTPRFFMVNWITIHLFLPNISVELFSKTTITELFHSVSFPKLSYKNSFLFIFLSCCIGNTYCAELAKDHTENIQKFDERKQQELDSLRRFYEEQQQNSVAHKVRDEPPPKTEKQSFILIFFDFVLEHCFISFCLALVFFKSISNFLWLVLSILKVRLNKGFNLLPKSFQRLLRKECLRFRALADYIMKNRDGIL